MSSTLAMDIITRKHLNILIQLAEADKQLAPVEKDLIFDIAKANKFPLDEVKNLIKNPEPIGSLGALSDHTRFEYLITCVELMKVDEKIFNSEILFCKDIAIKLGFKQGVIDFLVENIDTHSKDELRGIIFNLYA